MNEREMKDFEIGPSGRVRRIRGLIGYIFLAALLASAFAYLFFMLTLNWKIAVGSVAFLLGYMLLMGWWAERSSTDR